MNGLRNWMSLATDNLFLLLDLFVPQQGVAQRRHLRSDISNEATDHIADIHGDATRATSSASHAKPVLFDDDDLWRWNQEQEMFDRPA